MLLYCHLQVHTNEFTHVPMSHRIFSSENRPYLEDTLKVCHDTHLLVDLRRLGKAGWTIEVIKLEDIAASLRCSSNQLWSVDLNKVVVDEELSEELADSGREFENGLLSWRAQIKHSIVQASHHSDQWKWLFSLRTA